jgi:hypothetical protein
LNEKVVIPVIPESTLSVITADRTDPADIKAPSLFHEG